MINHTVPTAAALLLSNTRAAAMERELELTAAAIAERDARLIELNARIQALETADTYQSGHQDSQAERVVTPSPTEPFSASESSIPAPDNGQHGELLPVDGELSIRLSGLELGTMPKADETADTKSCFERSLKAVFLFSRMLGQDPSTEIQLRSKGVRYANPAEAHGSWPVLSLDVSLDILDLWWSGGHDLRFRCKSRQPVVLRCYQHDLDASGSVVLVSEALLKSSGMAIVESRLLNPFLPVLITSSTRDGTLLSSTLLPFPSLARGGLHAGEVHVFASNEQHLAALRRLSKNLLAGLFSAKPPLLATILVDVSHATGAEPLFATHLKQWLAGVMGIVVQPVLESLPEHGGRKSFLQESLNTVLPSAFSGQALQLLRTESASATLTLPADGIPSLHLLTARVTKEGESCRRIGSFIACDNKTGAPFQMIMVPDFAEDLTSFHPKTRPVWPVLTGAALLNRALFPLALRFCDTPPAVDPRMLLPLGAKTLTPLLQAAQQVKGRIAILLNGHDAAGFRASLTRQTVADDVDILADCGTEPDGSIVSLLANAAYVLVADSGVVLCDPHTLEILRLLASLDNVASAGCTLIGERLIKNKPAITFMDGGIQALVPSYATKISALSRCDVRTVLPFATLPTVGNSNKFFMVRTEVWQQLGNCIVDSAENYALHAIDAGYRHLTTDAVRACISQAPEETAPDTALWANLEKRERIGEKACVFKELSA